jgi:hypothetical protein
LASTEHGHHHKMGERLAEHLSLTDAQKAAYKEFVDARTKAVDDTKTSFAPPSRISRRSSPGLLSTRICWKHGLPR